MSEKIKLKHGVLSRIELSKIFAGGGAKDPPVHNNPGTGSDSPACNGSCQQINNCVNNYYTSCISESGMLGDDDRCMKMALLFCNAPE
jgi:hypothetical protein